ncbi:hypothetical protein RhiirA4_307439, partial [Rhizophagus irregularis]
FTCNPKWSEITRELLLYQTAADRTDLTARVFHMKKVSMAIWKNEILNKVVAYIYVMAFQKRGLPHIYL